MKLHIFRLSGHDFVHYRKIEIGANDRAVYQQSISCFIVYANFDWFLINLSFKRQISRSLKSQPTSITFYKHSTFCSRNAKLYSVSTFHLKCHIIRSTCCSIESVCTTRITCICMLMMRNVFSLCNNDNWHC